MEDVGKLFRCYWVSIWLLHPNVACSTATITTIKHNIHPSGIYSVCEGIFESMKYVGYLFPWYMNHQPSNAMQPDNSISAKPVMVVWLKSISPTVL